MHVVYGVLQCLVHSLTHTLFALIVRFLEQFLLFYVMLFEFVSFLFAANNATPRKLVILPSSHFRRKF